MTVAELKRAVLVRHLQGWAPDALRRGRVAVYVHGQADADDGRAAEAALRVFAGQPDLTRGRELTMLVLGADLSAVGPRLSAVPGAGAPGLTVHTVPGRTDTMLPLALRATGTARVPQLGYLDASAGSVPAPATLAALAGGRPAEVLAALPPGSSAAILRAAGFPLVTAVELATGEEPGQVLAYGTTQGRSLEAFKDALWAVDEDAAGVRYRDPGDPGRQPVDITPDPHPGPLSRDILAHLAEVGEATVTELRTYALTETVYRAADATRVLHTLIDAGQVARRPDQGRLGGDVVITAS